MPARCPATNRDGTPCNATPRPSSGYCAWHDPALAEERRQNAVKGGKARSNSSRARKAMKGGAGDLADIQAAILDALKAVRTGDLEAGPANAIAALSRAFVAVSGAADFDRRLAEVEQALAARDAS